MLDFVKVVRRPQNLKKHPNCFNVFSVKSKQVGYFVAFSENLIFRQPQAYHTQKYLVTKFAKDTAHQAVFTLRKSAAKVKSERRIDYRQMTVGLLLNGGGVSNKEKSRSARDCLAWVAKNQPVAR
jgi:hypothetical protein